MTTLPNLKNGVYISYTPQTVSGLNITSVQVLPFNNDDESDPDDGANDCSSHITVVEAEGSTTSWASSSSTSSVRSFPDFPDNITEAETVLAAIKKAINDIYAAHGITRTDQTRGYDTTENKKPAEKQAQAASCIRDSIDSYIESGEKSPLLLLGARKYGTPETSAISTNTPAYDYTPLPDHKDAFECSMDLSDVLENFGRIIQTLPSGKLGEDMAETAATLAGIVVAGYCEWAAIRKRLGEDAPYALILTMYRTYIYQCLRHAVASVRALPRFRDREETTDLGMAVRNDLLLCLFVVRRQKSVAVSEAWAASMSNILPQFVRSCTIPYDKSSLHCMPVTYTRYVSHLLGTLESPPPTRPQSGTKYPNYWSAFA